MSDEIPRVIGFDEAGNFRRAREVLDVAGYTEDGVREVLGRADLDTGPLDGPAALRRTRSGTPLHTLIRLFFLGVPVPVDDARRAVHPVSLHDWCRAGLLAVDDDTEVAPRVKLRPYQGLVLASDLRARMQAGGPADFVLDVSRSSTLVARTALRCRVRRTLDLGAGCGVLALLASAHSEEVWATDKNARAVAFTRFNAELNGIDNVQCLVGDLFEPIAGQRFDLVISNPPYVISPTARFLFSDSGVRGDHFCRNIVERSASFLEEGGYCQVMGNWAHAAGQSWQESLASWFDGSGCDVLVWGAETQNTSDYATNWIQQTEPGHLDRFPALYDAWMSYYDREGIEAVTYGLITMRRSSGHRNWVRFVQAPKGSAAPTGEYILRRFHAQDFLEGAGEDELLEHRFRLAADVRLEQHYAPKGERLSAVATRLHLARDPGYYTMEVDTTVATLVMSYQGERRLRDVFIDMAAALRVELDQLVPGGLAVVRRLVENGYLLPSGVVEGWSLWQPCEPVGRTRLARREGPLRVV